MPIYEYQCPECGKIEEKMLSYEKSKKHKFICEQCSVKMEKILSDFAFSFKGFGHNIADSYEGVKNLKP